MLVAPSAMGKSTIMRRLVDIDERFGPVSGFTSRKPRYNDDPRLYRYVSQSEAERLTHSDDIVQYAVHPTTGAIYGSMTQDYPAEYNVLDTLYSVVAELREAPFADTYTFSLVAPANIWKTRFLQRYPERTDEADKRLRESADSLRWSMQDTQTRWLLNNSTLDAVCKRLITLVDDPADPGDDGESYADAILQTIERGVWS